MTSSSSTTTSSVEVFVHPLVLLSVSDHYTRQRAQGNGRPVLGALVGVQSGRSVHVIDTFELSSTASAADYQDDSQQQQYSVEQLHEIDQQIFKNDMELHNAVYSSHECLGWYSTGSSYESIHRFVHEQMVQHNENPLFLQLDETCIVGGKDLPVSISTWQVQTRNDSRSEQFAKIPYSIATEEAERITVDHIANVSSASGKGSSVIPHIERMKKAIQMLHQRIKFVHKFVEDVISGAIPNPDARILHSIKELCSRLPLVDSARFRREFSDDLTDGLLISALSSLSQTAHRMKEAISKYRDVRIGGGGGRKRQGQKRPMMMRARDMF